MQRNTICHFTYVVSRNCDNIKSAAHIICLADYERSEVECVWPKVENDRPEVIRKCENLTYFCDQIENKFAIRWI